MPFLCREKIKPAIRKPYEDAYKEELRRALLAPGLTAEQRKSIKEQLAGVGRPRDYRADTPPKPGAVSFSGATPVKGKEENT